MSVGGIPAGFQFGRHHHTAIRYFNSSTTTENGGSFTLIVFFLSDAPLKSTGLIRSGFVKLL